MQIEIDQSGKIEDTERLTVIAFSNSINRSLLISAKDKRSIQSIFRKINQPRRFISKVFAAAIFVLIKDHLDSAHTIVIDKEYPGHEAEIKRYIYDICNKEGYTLNKHQIQFGNIGKRSPAHSVAYLSYKARKADIHLSAKDLLNILL